MHFFICAAASLLLPCLAAAAEDFAEPERSQAHASVVRLQKARVHREEIDAALVSLSRADFNLCRTAEAIDEAERNLSAASSPNEMERTASEYELLLFFKSGDFRTGGSSLASARRQIEALSASGAADEWARSLARSLLPQISELEEKRRRLGSMLQTQQDKARAYQHFAKIDLRKLPGQSVEQKEGLWRQLLWDRAGWLDDRVHVPLLANRMRASARSAEGAGGESSFSEGISADKLGSAAEWRSEKAAEYLGSQECEKLAQALIAPDIDIAHEEQFLRFIACAGEQL